MINRQSTLPPRAATPAPANDPVFDALYAPAARKSDAFAIESSARDAHGSKTPLNRRDLILALLLAATALLVRWPFIARGETLLHSDEAIVGLMAQDIREGTRFPIFFYGQRYMGALEAYVIAAILPFVSDPITALRLGPALFFAAFVAVQYLMLSRWFGRAAAMVGVAALFAAPPALAQWTISARGGYIEVLLWGTALWWIYAEWFATKSDIRNPKSEIGNARNFSEPGRPGPGLRLALLGFVIGSGMWINPAIAVFVAPVMVHAAISRGWLSRFDRLLPTLPVALPLTAFGLVVIVTSLWAVWVDNGQVRHLALMGLPRFWIAMSALTAVSIIVLARVVTGSPAFRFPSIPIRAAIHKFAPLVLGVLAGLTPTFLYTLKHLGSGQSVEPTVPLGFRPLWTCGETIEYLVGGLRMLLAADVRPYTDLVCVGRARPDGPMPEFLARVMPAADSLAVGALISLSLLFLTSRRSEIAALLRMKSGPHGPATFLLLALASVLGLFVLGGCTFNFATIRYLVPLLAVIPGLLAAVATTRAGRFACAALLTAWGVGQLGFHSTLGRPHPLHAVADALKRDGVETAEAEILDAHLLSYLTRQSPRVSEFNAFWPRLSHYRDAKPRTGPVHYVVHAADIDWMQDWTRHDWPGPPPPETVRLLWPRLKKALQDRPRDVLNRVPLPDGYELWTLSKPLEHARDCRGCSGQDLACAAP